MKNLQATVIIRNRGQLTIPEEIREALDWADSSSVVQMKVLEPKRIIIEPHQKENNVNWEAVWDGIALVRSFPGKRGHLAKFIAKDRQSHK